ncbi:MAG: hypothetical protein COA69_00685 [Robiginitomaculum sp.]|nr:MAG: hypothetical protein COA69_00685 [Robiginitomaculum sp.]
MYVKMGNNQTSTFLRFGAYSFDTHRLELWKKTERIPLKTQPARLLHLLLESAPETLSRQTLQEEIWNNGTTVEFDHGLNACVNQLRTALGDSASTPHYIATVPKRGYRLLPEVERVTHVPKSVGRKFAVGVFVMFGVVCLGGWSFLNANKNQTHLSIQETSPAYFEAMVKARRAFQESDPDSLIVSVEAYDQALSVFPGSNEAKGGKALAMVVLAGNKGFPVEQTYKNALILAEEIRQSDGPTTRSELVRGFVFLYHDWDVPAARKAFDLAVALGPDEAITHAWRAAVLAVQGERQAAAKESDIAVKLDPLSMAIAADRCWYLGAAGRYEEAVTACQWALDIEPDHSYTLMGLVPSLEKLGRVEDARKVLSHIASGVDKTASQDTDVSGQTLSQSEKLRAEYCKIADLLTPGAQQGKVALVPMAAFEAGCHRYERALGFLKQAKSGGESGALFYMIDPRFDQFRASDIGKQLDMTIAKRHS